MLPFAVTIIVTFACSVAGAMAAEHLLAARIPVLGSFAGLLLSHNPGIAFGMRFPSPWQELLIGGALCAVAYIAYRERAHTLNQIAFGMILAGALANIADRLQDGVVTDYFQVGTFPIFNLADSAITVGAALLLVQIFLDEIRKRSGLASGKK
ncbi:MAG TPA: signal peptidase II [Candidatus Peribacteria bacterium]|nr:signal peptidase II [Candidatus Peribacteria bacterium]